MALLLTASDHLSGHAHDGVSSKPNHYGPFVRIGRETGHGHGFLNNRGKILVGDMRRPRPTHQTRGINITLVGVPRLLNAVGGH